jgi:VanZ family protein
LDKKLKNGLRYWLPLGAYCLAIFIQSSLPSPDMGLDFRFSDKLLHFFAYGLLGILFFRALGTLGLKQRIIRVMVLSILLSTLYGISDEVHQYFVPSRSAEVADAVADMLGSIAGTWIYFRLFGLKAFSG